MDFFFILYLFTPSIETFGLFWGKSWDGCSIHDFAIQAGRFMNRPSKMDGLLTDKALLSVTLDIARC